MPGRPAGLRHGLDISSATRLRPRDSLSARCGALGVGRRDARTTTKAGLRLPSRAWLLHAFSGSGETVLLPSRRRDGPPSLILVRAGENAVVTVAVPFASDRCMGADRSTEQEVMGVLDALNEALDRRDLDATLALFVRHPEVTLIGSEEGETATGRSELRSFFERLFARPGTFRFEWRSCTVSARGDVAWFFADAIAHYTENDDVASVAYRTTGVLEREEHHWLFAQYHGSEPVRPET